MSWLTDSNKNDSTVLRLLKNWLRARGTEHDRVSASLSGEKLYELTDSDIIELVELVIQGLIVDEAKNREKK